MKKIAHNVIRYARLECKAKSKELSAGVADLVDRKWTVLIKKENEYTQQSNNDDCGVSMLRAAELIAEGTSPRIAEGEMTKERADLLTLLVHNDFGDREFRWEQEVVVESDESSSEGEDEEDGLLVIR